MTEQSKTDYEIADAIVADLPTLTADQAAWLIARIATKHDFVAVVFTPEDARLHIRNAFEADDVTRQITNADVEAFLASWEWRKGLSDVLYEEGFEMFSRAYDDLFDADGNLRSQ